MSVNNILDPTIWEDISWKSAKNEKYRGLWDVTFSYGEGDIVYHEGSLYQAISAINADTEFSGTFWALIDTIIDYTGSIPNKSGLTIFGENIYVPAIGYDEEFRENFVTTPDGAVLVASSIQVDSTREKISKIHVYRKLGDDKYVLSQTIQSPGNSENFAESFVISADGLTIAVTDKTNDDLKNNIGCVYIYRQQNTTFVLDQTLFPPQDEESEKFGQNLSLTDDILVVSSLNGDFKTPTTFDLASTETTFDGGYTKFSQVLPDVGAVYVFETINGKFVYAETLKNLDKDPNFGEIVLANNNHIYVTSYSTTDLAVIDYRKNKNSKAWVKFRELIKPVNVERIEGVYLYNKTTNQIITYLDYIDPIQGKIAGPADQEISFKTIYDPAMYNVGLDSNPNSFWSAETVGKVWWDLSTAKFVYPYQGDANYQARVWNKLQPEASIDVYEWVESSVLPSVWDAASNTAQGDAVGINGSTLYGDERYSQTFVYDPIAKSFSPRYYFWVKNKLTIPENGERQLNTVDIARLIESPRDQGYRFVSLLADNRFVLNNCESLVNNNDIVLTVKYRTSENVEQNTHNEYQLLSDGNPNSLPYEHIEQKWFDSLAGVDGFGNELPDRALPEKKKYGVQTDPNQSMFVDRREALRQVVDRVNSVLITKNISDFFDFTKLNVKDNPPALSSGAYDFSVSTVNDLSLISVVNLIPAKLSLQISDGKIISVVVEDPGYGYKSAPTYVISDEGNGAIIDISINTNGQVVSAQVVFGGENYTSSASIDVRTHRALVNSGTTKWEIYEFGNNEWYRVSTQSFDVSMFWEYADWYSTGFSKDTPIKAIVDSLPQLETVSLDVGDVIKVNDVNGQWALYSKILSIDEIIEEKFELIAKERGTIQFKSLIYDNSYGYDSKSFDSDYFDDTPSNEIKIIMQVIRDDLLVGPLRHEYNSLFFSSLRYIMSEQPYVDWMFKTSFVTVEINEGPLSQSPTFKQNNIENYIDYINEVKPYRTTVRELKGVHTAIETAPSSMTDFDLPPVFSPDQGKVTTSIAKISNNELIDFDRITQSSDQPWAGNFALDVERIVLIDQGSDYVSPPEVTITGGGGSGAKAIAVIQNGKVISVEVLNSGSGYLSAPSVNFSTGAARAVAILKNNKVRSSVIALKFDRINPDFDVTELNKENIFVSDGEAQVFKLSYPISTNRTTTFVEINGAPLFNTQYETIQVSEKVGTYTRDVGYLVLNTAYTPGTTIKISYKMPITVLMASDRINAAYSPTVNMPGKDLTQLMDGVEFENIKIVGPTFEKPSGWGIQPWMEFEWDLAEPSPGVVSHAYDFDTETFTFDTALDDGVQYNVYVDGVRVDDSEFNTPQQTNPFALIPSIIGDGETTSYDLSAFSPNFSITSSILVQDSRFDGASALDPLVYDLRLDGGDLAYTTALGVSDADYIYDGGGFYTPDTSKGPEELVPGHVAETVDIQIFTKPVVGPSVIQTWNYLYTGETNKIVLGEMPSSSESILVKSAQSILTEGVDYTVDWIEKSITFVTPSVGDTLSITTVSLGSLNFVDYGRVVSDGITDEIIIDVEYSPEYAVFVTANGVEIGATISGSTETIITFTTLPPIDTVINYVLYRGDLPVAYTQMAQDRFLGDGISTDFNLTNLPLYSLPVEKNTLVTVNNKLQKYSYVKEEVISGSQEIHIEKFQVDLATVDLSLIDVFVNDTDLLLNTQWSVDLVTNSIVVDPQLAVGSIVSVYVRFPDTYSIENGVLTFNAPVDENDEIIVFTFTNHDITDISRSFYTVAEPVTLVAGSNDYIKNQRLLSGNIDLAFIPLTVNYVWVAINGNLLNPSIDYKLSSRKNEIILNVGLTVGDEIEIVQFSNPSIRMDKTVERQFIDIFGFTHYKLVEDTGVTLTQDLNYDDAAIYVNDTSMLSVPNPEQNLPGVVFINKERIEYFEKTSTTLTNLRRGTLGTGVGQVYLTGSSVINQGSEKNQNYADMMQKHDVLADGNNESFGLPFSVDAIEELSIFVAGIPVSTRTIVVHDASIAFDSPDGDTDAPPDVSLSSNVLTFSSPPPAGALVTIIKKTGFVRF